MAIGAFAHAVPSSPLLFLRAFQLFFCQSVSQQQQQSPYFLRNGQTCFPLVQFSSVQLFSSQSKVEQL